MDFLTTEVTKYKTGCLVNFLPCMAIYICSRSGSLWSDSLTIFYHVFDRSSEIELLNAKYSYCLTAHCVVTVRPSKPASMSAKNFVSPDIMTDVFLLIARHLTKSSDILTIGKERHLMKYFLYLSCIICKYNETHSHLTGIYYYNRK